MKVNLSYIVILLIMVIPLGGFTKSTKPKNITYGDRTSLGDGYMQTYLTLNDDGSPQAIGVEFLEATLSNLPPEFFDGNNCWDVNRDGMYSTQEPPYECIGGHQRILFLPKSKNTPFKWLLVNWNTIGHDPQKIYTIPHFDFHFYTMDYVKRNFIRPGKCSFLVNCEDFKTAMVPVPSQYMPKDYKNLKVVEVRMGNHLIDTSSPEFQEGGRFTHTFIYGAYEGHITFWEPMVTVGYFQSKPDQCFPIKQASEYEVRGFYPTKYCIRYIVSSAKYTVSLEDFKRQ